MSRGSEVALRFEPVDRVPDLVKRLRQEINTPVGEIVVALRAATPILIGNLFGLDHHTQRKRLLALLADLDRQEIRFQVLVNGEPESRELFTNHLRLWHEISYDVAMESDLEAGDPSEEALRWATGDFDYPPEDEEDD